MYNLYYSPGACSLAIHVLLNELEVPMKLTLKSTVENFTSLVPTGAVPALGTDQGTMTEGAAIALYLMEKHPSPLLSKTLDEKSQAIEWMMFGNATIHPAYSKLFFISKNIEDGPAKQKAFAAATESLEKYWKIVDERLSKNKFVGGTYYSAADIMMTVYANWNNYFPFEIKIPERVKTHLTSISQRPAFQRALETEKVKYAIK